MVAIGLAAGRRNFLLSILMLRSTLICFVDMQKSTPQSYEVIIPFGEYNIINAFSSQVRLSNPDVKTLLSIRGDKKIFSDMASDPSTRDIFIKSSIKAAVDGDFNGLDLRWLYPSTQDDMQNFDYLITEWRKAAEEDARENNRAPWLLVASVSNAPYVEPHIHVVYPATAIIENLDWVNLISYDFYTPTLNPGYTGPSSAFINRKANILSVHFGIYSWSKSLGDLPFEKIVFGIPFHGWAWELANPLQHDVFSKANGPAVSTTGEYEIAPDGKIDYYDIKNFIHETQAEVVPSDGRFLIAYTFNATTTWIAYEGEDTIPQKIYLAKSMMALGYFASDIAADDELNTLATVAKSSWS